MLVVVAGKLAAARTLAVRTVGRSLGLLVACRTLPVEYSQAERSQLVDIHCTVVEGMHPGVGNSS
jgi:hypothetical protein